MIAGTGAGPDASAGVLSSTPRGGTVDPAFGFELVIFGFVAAVLGGMGSTTGALAGGVVAGVMQQMVGGYISSAAQHGMAFALLVLILVVRPQGLFGERDIAKV